MGKARRFFGRDIGRDDRLSKSLSRQSNTLRSHNITPVTITSSVPNNENIKSVGAVHVGPEGYIADDLNIASGILDLTTNPAGDTVRVRKYININPESGTSDTLDLITTGGTEFPQQELVLIGQSGDTITITHDSGSASGNNRAILCPGGSNYTLSGTDAVSLFYDFALSKYRITGDANTGGGGGVSFPIEPTVTDNSDTWTGTQTLDLNSGDGHVYKWTIDQDLTFASAVSNIPASGTQRTFELEFVHDGVGGTFTVTLPSNFADENGNAVSSFDISSGRAIFSCRVNDGTNFIVLQKNVTTSSAVEVPTWTQDHDAANFDLDNMDKLTWVQDSNSVTGTAYQIVVASNDFIFNVPTGRNWSFREAGVEKWQMSDTLFSGANITLTESFSLNNSAADPTVAGEFRQNAGDVKVYTGGGVVNLSDVGSGGMNQQMTNMSGSIAANLDIKPDQATGGNLGGTGSGEEWFNLFTRRVTFPVATTLGASDYSLGRVGTTAQYNIPTGATHRFTINGTEEMELSNTLLTLTGVGLDLENNSIFDVNQIQLTGSSGDTIFGFIGADANGMSIQTQQNGDTLKLDVHDGTSVTTAIEIDGSSGGTIDVNGFNMANCGILTFDEATGTEPQIASVSNDLTLNVGTSDEIQLEMATTDEYVFDSSQADWKNNQLVNVSQIDLTTAAGASVGSLVMNDLSTDIFEIRLGSTSDFLISDNGSTRAEFFNTTSTWSFEGSSILRLPEETTINDRTSAPSTPPSGRVSLYVINSSGAQSLRIKFDNGTEKTIETDT